MSGAVRARPAGESGPRARKTVSFLSRWLVLCWATCNGGSDPDYHFFLNGGGFSRQGSETQRSSCLCFPSAGTKPFATSPWPLTTKFSNVRYYVCIFFVF